MSKANICIVACLSACAARPQIGDAQVTAASAEPRSPRATAKELVVGGLTSTLPAQDLRQLALTAVRRLASEGDARCTGTLIRRTTRSRYGFLTAAHCVFALDSASRIGDRLADYSVEGIRGSLPRARVAAAFSACAASHETLRTCHAEGGADLALIELTAEQVAGNAVWDECDSPPPDIVLQGFGFGLRRGRHPLVSGTLWLESRSELGAWTGVGESYRVVVGDSGGPVIASRDDTQLGLVVPRVCFTISAIEFRTSEDPGGSTARTILQPAWNLETRLGPS